jgi:hypothetical protein
VLAVVALMVSIHNEFFLRWTFRADRLIGFTARPLASRSLVGEVGFFSWLGNAFDQMRERGLERLKD